MAAQLPLTSSLSQVLVALTIEADNEYEHRAPHFTTDHKVGALGRGPWLISTAMYVNFLRFVPDDGIPMRDLAAMSGADEPVHPAYHGMRRWGYVTYTPDIAGSAPRAKDGDALVGLTPAGARARALWEQTLADVERSWADRGLAALRRSLIQVAESVDTKLPEYLPVVGFDYRTPRLHEPVSREPSELGLLALLAQTLLALTIEYEAAEPLSLTTAQGLLRPLRDGPTRVADLTEVSGIAKKAWSSAAGQLERSGHLATEPGPGGRGKAVRLTDNGAAVVDASNSRLASIDAGWRKRDTSVDALRGELEKIVGDGTPSSPVFAGMEPYPECWRAKLKPLRVLPHQPLVSHRGGYPDGS